MLIDSEPQATNTTRSYGLQLAGAEEESLAGLFDGSESFRVILWSGDSQAPVWQSDSAVAWDAETDFTTQEQPVAVLTVPRSAIEGLQGIYSLQVILNPDVDDIEVWSGQIRFVEAAGVSAPQPTYATFEDLEDEFPGIADLQELGVDQTGFAEERAWARCQVDSTLAARTQVELEGYDRLGIWDPTRRDALESLEDHLAAGRMKVTSELRRICALWALGRILTRQSGNEKVQQGQRYLAEARWMTLGFVGRIDADGDGVYELAIS